MAIVQERRFSILDAMILVAALAVGLFLLRWNLDEGAAYPRLQFPIQSMGGIQTKAVRDGCVWSAVLATPITFAMLLIGLRPSGDSRRRRLGHPGLAACFSAAVVWILLRFHRSILITLEYQTTSQSPFGLPSPPFQKVMLPYRLAPLPPVGPDFAETWLMVDGPTEFPLIGLAVGLVWLVLGLGRNWNSQRTWLDRAGRALGWYWIGCAGLCWMTETVLRFMI